MRILLALSLMLNLTSAGVASRWAFRRMVARRVPIYAELAAERFSGTPGGSVVFAGDSHIGSAPLLDMLTPYRQWGIGGQAIADIATWLPGMLNVDVQRLVLSAGTNDVIEGTTAHEVVRRYKALLDALPDIPTTILGIPPVDGHEAVALTVSDGLRDLAVARGADFIALPRAGLGDGIHLSHDDYMAVAERLREQVDM